MPTVIEVNGDDIAELRLLSRWKHAVGLVSRGVLLRAAAGLVFVTDELARSPSFASFGKPSVVIGNGIALSEYPEFPAPANDRPRLLFLGHPGTPWHGLDHVVELALSARDWQFDIVGPDATEMRDAPINVTFHGSLEVQDYAPIMRNADVAIGTLGLYRKHMEEASPLKVREYLARGIPTMIAYRDTDFPAPVPFLLTIQNDPRSIRESGDMIARFVVAVRGTRVPREAISHLDVGPKEHRRIEFLASILGSKGTA
jgi:hypothetical protein